MEDIPWQANVYGMYLQKVDFIIHLTACGSLRENDNVGDLILFDQIIDFTKRRPTSLGVPALESVTYYDFSKPISEILINFAHEIFLNNDIKHHVGGTMLSEEGPKFSSIAESKMYKIWGADFINMTSCPEVSFCRELSIPVLAIAMVTNKVKFDTPILSEEISSNIAKHKDLTPLAMKLLFENLPENFDFQKIIIEPYNVVNFDLRGEKCDA